MTTLPILSTSRDSIARTFTAFGVPFHNWGKANGTNVNGHCKGHFGHFCKAIETGEVYVTIERIDQKWRPVVNANVSTVTVRIFSGGRWQTLKEHRHNGREWRQRPFPGSVGEGIAILLGESPREAAERGLAEELGGQNSDHRYGGAVHAPNFRDPRCYDLIPTTEMCSEPIPSDWCDSGILYSRYIRRFFDCVITANREIDLYRPYYTEQRRGIERMFIWKYE